MGGATSGSVRAQSAGTTTTSLVVSSGVNAVSSVSAGTVVTLTASVTSGSLPITPGLVKFCDASAKYCEDIHIIGTAQLTSAGVAKVKFRPGIGSHSYKAVFVGTNSYAGSTSSSVPLTVTGLYPTSTTFTETGGLGTYNVAATVSGTGLYSHAPSGTVSFVDATNGNAILAQAALNPGASTLSVVVPADRGMLKGNVVEVGDFSERGIPDLAFTNPATSTAFIFLGNGDGTFNPGNSYPTGPDPYALAVADFNSDGHLDLAIQCTGSVTILLGNGDGTFTPTAVSPATGSGSQSIVAGDFNGDGIPDLAVANYVDNSITVLLGNGDGTFNAAPVITFPYNTNPSFLATADFNGDGKLDLATFANNTSQVIVLLGKGDGTFPTTVTTSTQNSQAPALTADFNGDGIPDLFMTSSSGEDSVFLGTGNGAFTPGAQLISIDAGVTMGDFNGDGIPDLATSASENYVYYFLGNGDGSFATGPIIDVGTITNQQGIVPAALASADFNGDGLSDVAVAGYISYPTTNNGWFVPLISTPVAPSTGSTSITVGAGNHAVEASYSGDSNYSASASSTATLAGPAATTLGLALSSGPHVYGQSLVLTATLSPYSGSGYSTNGEPVSFYNNGALIGNGNLSGGVATLSLSSLSAGSYSFSTNYAGDGKFLASSSSSIAATISQATPSVSWTTPSAITYGTALSAAQLSASSPVAGTFFFSPSAGTVLTAGSQTLSVTFTPTDATDYTTASAQVTLTVNQAAPTITWAAPSAITYGTVLSATQLNASSPVAGSFAYSPVAGTVLNAGTRTLTATFTPTDTTDYKANTATVSVVVNQATPTISWAAPSAITFGTALGAAQLNATASVAGTFIYSPWAGTVLGAGSQTLSATFSPADAVDYKTVSATVTLAVNQATPAITWVPPTGITYGTALSGTQLNASSPVAGSFTYSPVSGTLLNVGSHTLTATFSPADTTDYKANSATVSLVVNQAAPTISWSSPTAITYGTPLGSTQLNASSSVAGTFSYSPAAGTVLTAGPQTLSVTFTPTDTTDYTTATAHVALTVNQVIPTITWTNPIPITYGFALGNTQLNATASVPGTFAYNPAAGTILAVGDHTLSTTFTPSDSTDCASTTATVDLWVDNPYPLISNMSPSYVTAGASAFALTVNGNGFMPSSTVYWGNTALITTYVSPTQLTAAITATQVASPGTSVITVQTGTPGGGTSNSFQFQMDTSNAGSAPVTITTTSVVVAAGSAANYTVSIPSNMTGVSVGCLNLPAGASCTYVANSSVVTISTSSTTPPGTYSITVVFTGMIPASTLSGWILAPFLLVPVWLLRRRMTSTVGQWFALCLLFLLTGVAVVGCGGSSGGSTGGGQMVQVTTSNGISLTVH